MNEVLAKRIRSSVGLFLSWLGSYGETSYDFQSFYAGRFGRKAKAFYYNNTLLGMMGVAPLVFCEAFLPWTRRFFWHKQRFPIADAHYAMGFAFYYNLTNDEEYYKRAVHFLGVLEQTRSPGYEHSCWGYPYDWETKNGTIFSGTPLITTTPYAYEGFLSVYQIDKNAKWRELMRSIAEHAIIDIKDFGVSARASTCTYTPFDKGGVVNANAYRAFLLADASKCFGEERYWRTAERNLNFVLESQHSDGSWYYSVDGKNDFIDHFHTCFVLKALAKIEQLTGHRGCREAIEKGVAYYVRNLFDEKGLPKPFSKAPRLTVYRRELYDYAECINLAVLLRNRFEELDKILGRVLEDLLTRWQKPDGSFRSRELFVGWDNVPMHRWAQAQLFRSLCFFLSKGNRKS